MTRVFRRRAVSRRYARPQVGALQRARAAARTPITLGIGQAGRFGYGAGKTPSSPPTSSMRLPAGGDEELRLGAALEVLRRHETERQGEQRLDEPVERQRRPAEDQQRPAFAILAESGLAPATILGRPPVLAGALDQPQVLDDAAIAREHRRQRVVVEVEDAKRRVLRVDGIERRGREIAVRPAAEHRAIGTHVPRVGPVVRLIHAGVDRGRPDPPGATTRARCSRRTRRAGVRAASVPSAAGRPAEREPGRAGSQGRPGRTVPSSRPPPSTIHGFSAAPATVAATSRPRTTAARTRAAVRAIIMQGILSRSTRVPVAR